MVFLPLFHVAPLCLFHLVVIVITLTIVLVAILPVIIVRTEVLSSGPQGQRRPRASVARGGLDQKGLVCPTEVIEYEIP